MDGLEHTIEAKSRDFVVSTKSKLKKLGSCEIDGVLYDSNKGYPILDYLAAGASTVKAQLFFVADTDAAARPKLNALDLYEEIDPKDPTGGIYERRFVYFTNLKPDNGLLAFMLGFFKSRTPKGAWAYVVKPMMLPPGCVKVESGDWAEYVSHRS